jgi:hypothetical protein
VACICLVDGGYALLYPACKVQALNPAFCAMYGAAWRDLFFISVHHIQIGTPCSVPALLPDSVSAVPDIFSALLPPFCLCGTSIFFFKNLPPTAPNHLPVPMNILPDIGSVLPELSNDLPDVGIALPEEMNRLPDEENELPDRENGLPEAVNELPDVENKLPEPVNELPDVEN